MIRLLLVGLYGKWPIYSGFTHWKWGCSIVYYCFTHSIRDHSLWRTNSLLEVMDGQNFLEAFGQRGQFQRLLMWFFGGCRINKNMECTPNVCQLSIKAMQWFNERIRRKTKDWWEGAQILRIWDIKVHVAGARITSAAQRFCSTVSFPCSLNQTHGSNFGL